ncbi:MAG: hydrogenase 3 maturation endopeptidase HyCI [Elusimicrobiales bacterium]
MKEIPLSAFSGKAVILGVGNDMRGDDGAGPALVKLLSGKCPGITLIDGGQTPENKAFEIIRLKPSSLVIVDAADMGLKPGQTALIDGENISNVSFSSHALPLTVLTSYLEREIPGLKVYIAGIQPKTTAFGGRLSREARAAIKNLAGRILNAQRA